MTPERVTELSRIPFSFRLDGLPDLRETRLAIERAITLAVNEALEAAERAIDSEAKFWSDTDDTRAHDACLRMLEEVRALKLPEER